ncbi:MAG: hypothetical protein M3R49_11220, partial [Chloroflexota bacterium]|nr:hypothetical protein [Chloroflexota bacterium]
MEVIHLLTSTLVRDTGLEIVHASVPPSRSARSRLIVAKITAMTMNWVPIACMRLSIGCNDTTLEEVSAVGKLLMIHSLIRLFAAAGMKMNRLTTMTIHGRLLSSQSMASLRRRLRSPSSVRWGWMASWRPATSTVVAFMRHAPWN